MSKISTVPAKAVPTINGVSSLFFEQPGVIQATLNGRVGKGEINTQLFGDSAQQLMDSVQAVQIIACGTSYHAGMVARYWIEELAGIPCQVEIASEYR